MLYVSRGVARPSDKPACAIVNRCGKDYELTELETAAWYAGSRTPKTADQVAAATVHNDGEIALLKDKGLIATTDMEDYVLGAYTLLTECIITPVKHSAMPPLRKDAAFAWKWIRKAGLRLTFAELTYLFEHEIKPKASLCGARNRQALVERIYTAENIEDGILEAEMESARRMPSVLSAVLLLLKKEYIAVI